MTWNPYTDQKNRAYSGILTTLFPEQTKTLPRILIWSLIFLIDLTAGIVLATHFGLFQPDHYSNQAAMLLKSLNDFERIGDHALNLLESAEEFHEKNLSLSDAARKELSVLMNAVAEIVELSFSAFYHRDLQKAYMVEPLEQVIDDLKEKMRVHHILRLQQGSCSIETGFIWSDLLTALERVGDHCSNVAGSVVDAYHHDMNTHEALRSARVENEHFTEQYAAFAAKYSLK